MFSVVDTQEDLLAGVPQRVDADRRHHCARESRRKTLPHFTVDDYVLVAGLTRQSKHRKPMTTGPWRVANDDKEHMYAVQHLVAAELRDVHVERMRFYADDQLEIIGELLKVENHGEYHIRSISVIKRAAGSDDFIVKVAWEGLEEAESTWEPVSRVFHDAPAVLRKELKALRLKAKRERALLQQHGLCL